MTTRAKNWILRAYLDSAHWNERESTILVTDTFCVLTSVIAQFVVCYFLRSTSSLMTFMFEPKCCLLLLLQPRFYRLAANDGKYYKRIFFLQLLGEYSTTLSEVTLQIISDSECNSTYSFSVGITESMICAGDSNGGKGACSVKGSW